MAKRLSRIERDIERLKEKISEYQQQLKELEAAKTEQENLQIIQLVRSMNMKPDEFAAFLRSGALTLALNTRYVFAGVPAELDLRDIDGIRKWYTASLVGMGGLLDILMEGL